MYFKVFLVAFGLVAGPSVWAVNATNCSARCEWSQVSNLTIGMRDILSHIPAEKKRKATKEEMLKAVEEYQQRQRLGEFQAWDVCPQEESPPLPDTDVDVHLNLRGEDKGTCGYFDLLTAQAKVSQAAFSKALRNTNWDPCCVPSDIKFGLGNINSDNIGGFTIGVEAGFSPTSIGASYGNEMVVMLTPNGNLELAIFEYELISVGLSVKGGPSVTQGVLKGTCKKIDDYAGYFKSWHIAGLKIWNSGISSHPWDLNARFTGCNSESLASGATLSLAGVSGSHYKRLTKKIELRGPRVQGLIDMLKAAREDSWQRNKANGSLGLTTDLKPRYDYKSYRRPECGDGIFQQMCDKLTKSKDCDVFEE